MALRLNGTDPFLRASPGAFVGYTMQQSPLSVFTLLKRGAVSNWHGICVMDTGGTTNYSYPQEFNPSNQLSHANTTADGGRTSSATFNNTTDFMILGMTWNGTTSAGAFTFASKVGAGAWTSNTATVGATTANTVGAGYRWIIGNEAALGDDANFDWVCTGAIKSQLSSGTYQTLDMTSIASWDAVFTGSGAWLLDGQAIGSRTDRTGNGGNEVSRSASVTLVSDPAGWSWGASASADIPNLAMASYQGAY